MYVYPFSGSKAVFNIKTLYFAPPDHSGFAFIEMFIPDIF